MAILAVNGGARAVSEQEALAFEWPKLEASDEAAVLEALRNNYWGGIGDENLPSAVFEREFAAYNGSAHALVVANGSVSLELALKACGIQPGDRVIVPAITFYASASAIVSAGAVPVFADVDPKTCQITAAAIEDAAGTGAKAVIVVHYGGYMADMDAIMAVSKKFNLKVIEDCAHAHGSEWRGKKAGSFGEFGSFSFQHSKSLPAGEGGAVTTDDESLYEKASLIRNIGRATGQRTYGHYVVASNWRLGGLQGALLLSKFRRFPELAATRHESILYFQNELKKIEGLAGMPDDERQTKRGCYFYVFGFDAEKFGCSRKKFIEAMRAEGIYAVISGYDRPIYKEPAFAPDNLRPFLHPAVETVDYNALYLPNSEKWAETQVAILHYYYSYGRAAVDRVLEAIHKIKNNVSELN